MIAAISTISIRAKLRPTQMRRPPPNRRQPSLVQHVVDTDGMTCRIDGEGFPGQADLDDPDVVVSGLDEIAVRGGC